MDERMKKFIADNLETQLDEVESERSQYPGLVVLDFWEDYGYDSEAQMEQQLRMTIDELRKSRDMNTKQYIHLTYPRGGIVCGVSSIQTTSDINWVSCSQCYNIHERLMEQQTDC